MNTVNVLRSSLSARHEELAARFDRASTMRPTRGQPRKGYEHIDTFLTVASKHLNAVDAVLLSEVRRAVPDGDRLVHEYLHVARRLELEPRTSRPASTARSSTPAAPGARCGPRWAPPCPSTGTASSSWASCSPPQQRGRARRARRPVPPRRGRGAEPTAPLRPAHRPPGPRGPPADAHGRLVLGRRRGPDGAGAAAPGAPGAGPVDAVPPGRPALRRGRPAGRGRGHDRGA